MLVKIRRRKLESQSASQTCVLLSDSDLTHCGVRDMWILSSKYSGKDTHGLMTVHLACSSRGETSAKSVTGSTQRNSQPGVAAGMKLQCCTTLPCPGLPTSGTEGPSYGWRLTRLEGAGMLTEASSCHRTAEPLAWRRSSWQLTVRDADPTNVCPFTTWCCTRYWVWTLEKVLNTPHTELTKWTVPLLLVASTVLVVSVICYRVHSHLGTLLKCCCIKKQSPTATWATPRVAPHQRTHHQRESSQR